MPGPDANFLETSDPHAAARRSALLPSLNARLRLPRRGQHACRQGRYPARALLRGDHGGRIRAQQSAAHAVQDLRRDLRGGARGGRGRRPWHEQFKATISPNLTDANFSFQPEVHLDTPSAAELKLAQRKGRTGRGQRVRTLPTVPPQIPYGIAEVEPDEEAKIEKPLESELEHLIVDPPFDEWRYTEDPAWASTRAARSDVSTRCGRRGRSQVEGTAAVRPRRPV